MYKIINSLKYFVLFLIILISAFSCSTLVRYTEKEPYDTPKLVEPNQDEKNGLKLKTLLPGFFLTILNKGSIKYEELSYDSKNRDLFGKKYNMEDCNEYDWQTKKINDIGDYTIQRITKYYNEEYLILDKNNKPIKFNRAQKTKFITLIENCRYYIPDKIINIGDEWQYDLADVIPSTEYNKEDKKYYEINLNAKFKLIGYTLYYDTRCALIESDINCTNADVNLYEEDKSNRKGGGMVYEISINNLVFLDYAHEKVVYTKTCIKNIVKGNYAKKWGDTPEEAISNIKKGYENFINLNKTYCGQYFYNYIY